MIAAPPTGLIPCFVNPLCVASGGVASLSSEVAKVAATGVLDVISSALSAAAAWLLGHVIDLVTHSAPVHLGSKWFVQEEGAMATLLELVVLPILMAATIGSVLRQDTRRLGRVWCVGLPVASLVGVAGIQFAGLALSATDAMCQVVTGASQASLGARFSDLEVTALLSGAPQIVAMVVFSLLIVGCILVWIELLLRAAAVYLALFFMPLALAGYIWPATVATAKRAVEILVALILSKFVIVASLVLGVSALAGGRSADDALVASAILLIAGFAPFCLLRLAPIVEAAAIGHLEGLARRPFRAAGRAASAVAAGPSQIPVAGFLLSRVRGSDRGDSQPVAAQPLPQRRPDYRTSGVGTADG